MVPQGALGDTGAVPRQGGSTADAPGAGLTSRSGRKFRVMVTVELVKLMPPSQLDASGKIFNSL